MTFEEAELRVERAKRSHSTARKKLTQAIRACRGGGSTSQHGLAADADRLLLRLDSSPAPHETLRTYAVLRSFSGRKGAQRSSRRLGDIVRAIERSLRDQTRLLEEPLERLAAVAAVLGEIERAGSALPPDSVSQLTTLAGRSPEIAQQLLRVKARAQLARTEAARSLADSLACRQTYLRGWVDTALGTRPEAQVFAEQVEAAGRAGAVEPEALLECHAQLDSVARRIARQAEQGLHALVRRTCEHAYREHASQLGQNSGKPRLTRAERRAAKMGLQELRDLGLKRTLSFEDRDLGSLRAFWTYAAHALLARVPK
jgi:hypothetical protein